MEILKACTFQKLLFSSFYSNLSLFFVALKRIQDNDPEMKELVVNGAVWKLNSSAHLEALVTGLMNNTVLEVLRLADCGLTDGDINVSF